MSDIIVLPPDGERLIPEFEGQIVHEHLHRYAVARQYTTGKDVLDIACGEGYGSNLLSKDSKSVTGVDIAENAIAHARAKYRHKNLKFVVGSCTSIPLPSNSIDVAISFETLEHFTEHEIFIRELKRVLRPDGLLIISSPDKRNYSDVPNHQNPFHLRELYHEEFKELIRDNFKETTFAKQEYNPGSIIELECATPISHISGDYTKTDYKSLQDLATYSIAFASDISLPRIQSSVFKSHADKNEQDLFNTQLFISSSPEFNEKDSVRVTSWLGKRTLIEFVNIEKHIDHGPIHLRIDPSDTAGVLEIHEIKILTIANDGEIHSIISPRAKQLNNLHPISGNPSMHFSSNTDPNFILEPIEWDGISKISLNFDVTLHHDLSSLANYIDQKEAELEQHGTSITELQAELSERDDAIHKAEATLEQRDANIVELKNSVEQRDLSITELQAELSERDDAIHKAEATLEQRDASIRSLNNRILNLKNQFFGIIDSPIWKITWIFRKFPIIGNKMYNSALIHPLPQKFYFYFDTQSKGLCSCKNPFTFVGWFFDKNGAPAKRIRARIGANSIEAKQSNRPDVAAAFHENLSVALNCGFELIVQTQPGWKIIIIEAQTADRKWHQLKRRLFKMKGRRTSPPLKEYALEKVCSEPSTASITVNSQTVNGIKSSNENTFKFTVVIDGRILSRKLTGSERYIYKIIYHLREIAPQDQLSLEVLVWDTPQIRVQGVEYVLQNHMSSIEKADVFFKTFPPSEIIYLKEMAKAKSCLFLPHDLIAWSHPDYYNTLSGYLKQCLLMQTGVRIADRVLAISLHNASDLNRCLLLPRRNINVVYDGSTKLKSMSNKQDSFDMLNLAPGSYFICVGTDYPHKNIKKTVLAFIEAKDQGLTVDKLVIVGAQFSKKQFNIEHPNVIRLTHIDDGLLKNLMQYAFALVYPSLYEGFGLPPLEAMSLGVPVIASHATSLPEVCGNAALLIDASKKEVIKNALFQIASNESLRTQLIEAGHKRATQFSWSECARRTFDILIETAKVNRNIYDTKTILQRHMSGQVWDNTIVLVTHVKIMSASAGNEVRVLRMIQHLRRSGYFIVLIYTPLDRNPITINERHESLKEVDLFLEILPDIDSDYAGIGKHKKTILNWKPEPRLEKWKDQECTFCPDATAAAVLEVVEQLSPRAVIAEYLWTSRVLTMLPYGIVKIIDTHDKFSSKEKQVRSHGVQDDLAMTECEEATFLNRADIILAIQPDEADKFALIGTKSKIITVGCDMNRTPAKPITSEMSTLIVGSDNQINAHFVKTFVKKVWPHIYEKNREATLVVAGKVSNTIDHVPEGVSLLGYVDDLSKVYDKARVVLNPVAAGTGLKIKTIEAISYAKPLITTSEGASGLPESEKSYYLQADTDDAWVEKTLMLLENENLCRELSRNAENMATKLLSAHTVYAPLLTELSNRKCLPKPESITNNSNLGDAPTILCFFLRYGTKDYNKSFQDLQNWYSEHLPHRKVEFIIIDNALTEDEESKSPILVWAGNNDYGEFSGFSTAIKRMGSRTQNYELLHFVTSAYKQLYCDYLKHVTETALDFTSRFPACLGHIDSYDEPIRFKGERSRHWIRTCFFFLSPASASTLSNWVNASPEENIFNQNNFLTNGLIDLQYQKNLRDWLEGSEMQGVRYHTPKNKVKEFKRKALAIINEHSLSIEMRKSGLWLCDFGFFYAKLQNQTNIEDSYKTDWETQVKDRSHLLTK